MLRAAFKPTPSIGQTQDTISISKGENDTLAIVGRHDPCIVPRAVPCVEAAAAVALLDLICRMEQVGKVGKYNGFECSERTHQCD